MCYKRKRDGKQTKNKSQHTGFTKGFDNIIIYFVFKLFENVKTLEFYLELKTVFQHTNLIRKLITLQCQYLPNI